MKLTEILAPLNIRPDHDCEISDIVYDSRKAHASSLFAALPGSAVDGHNFVRSAYDKGCRAFLCEHKVELPADARVFIVPDARHALALCSAAFFSYPARRLTIIGITGTKGKTSVAHIIQSVLNAAGVKCGIIGTVGAGYDNVKLPTVNTTPESYELHKLFAQMLDGGCKAVAMEVSSLGLKAHRTDGIEFDYAVFTNLAPDHIGGAEHKSFEEYKDCKKLLFKQCKMAVMIADDPYSAEFISCCASPVVTYGRNAAADYRLTDVQNYKSGHVLGTSFFFAAHGQTNSFTVSMPGEVNALNALCAVAIADLMKIDQNAVSAGLFSSSAKGRGQVLDFGTPYSIIIDYAHNGVSLQSILSTLAQYDHGRIITVFGSVGDRAFLRRHELGETSGKMADLSIVTADDPGYEDVQNIIDDITAAIDSVGGKWVSFIDRADAIRYALNTAEKGDIVVLAGKGHEEFMKVKGEKQPFSEVQVIKNYLKEHYND